MTSHRSSKRLSAREQRTLRRAVLILLVVGFLWLLFSPGKGLFRYRRLQHRMQTLAEKNRDLERRNAELQKEIRKLATDDHYLEELARKKYGLLRKDETVYEFGPVKKKKKN